MKILIACILAVFFIGCGPKYVVKNDYIAPTKSNALACTKSCASTKSICSNDCQNRYEICKQDAYNRAKDISSIALLKYNESYSLYQDRLRAFHHKKNIWEANFDLRYQDYHYFRKKCDIKKERYACARVRQLNTELRYLKRQKPLAPLAPRRPSFSEIYENELQGCSSECNCQNEYDNCFVSCGGKIVTYKICVENCD